MGDAELAAENEVLKRRIERAVSVVNMELGGHPIGNRLRSVLGVQPRMSDAIKAVTDAWTVEGAFPQHHSNTKNALTKNWPTLHRAIEQLIEATQTRVNVIPNPVAPPIGAKVQAIPSDKVKFTIHMVVTRNDDGVPPWQATLVGRKRAFKDAAELIWMHWVRAKHGGNT